MLDDYNNKQLKKRAAQQRWRTNKLLEYIEEGRITENKNYMNQQEKKLISKDEKSIDINT